jgi:hypothetical protein
MAFDFRCRGSAEAALGTAAEEALVEEARRLRNNPGPHEHAFVTQCNDMMAVRSTSTDY